MNPKSPRRQASTSAKLSPIERRLAAAIDAVAGLLGEMDDQLLRARIAERLGEQAKLAESLFAAERTAAFDALRGEGWSLGDLADEFGLTRARVAQIACRDRYR